MTNYAPHSVGHHTTHGVILCNELDILLKGEIRECPTKKAVYSCSEGGRGEIRRRDSVIDENEVTAGHAASVGQVDDEPLFYLAQAVESLKLKQNAS